MKPNILLVDDHPSNLIALEATLGKADYTLVTASSGAEALAAVETQDFALILLDIHMPDMDGYEVARRLKASPRARNIPVILITAIYREDPHVQKGYEVGAVDFFSKPFNPDVLRMKVGIYADIYRKNLLLKNQRKEDARRSAEMKTILENIPDAVYVGDEAGVTLCNSAALDMFGLSSSTARECFEQLALRMQMRYPDTDEPIPPDDQPYAHALRGEQQVTRIKIRNHATDEDVILTCAAAPVRYESEIIGAVVVNEAPQRR